MIGNAVKVMRIPTDEETDQTDSAKSAAQELGSLGSKALRGKHVGKAPRRNRREGSKNAPEQPTGIKPGIIFLVSVVGYAMVSKGSLLAGETDGA